MVKLVKDIGESKLIEGFRKRINIDSSVLTGIGDDSAVLKLDKKRFLLLTCDMLIEGVHFSKRASPQAIGKKAMSICLSDIAAMGGQPRWAVVSIGLPAQTTRLKIDGIYRGLISRAKRFKVNIVGGDTVRSKSLVINTSVLGVVEKRNLVTRKRAKVGDILFVSGRLGGSGRLRRHLNFIPALEESRYLVNNFHINSMIDLSDGLFSDLKKICRESNVGAVIYEGLIPLNRGASLDKALYEGEDFKLLFSAGIDIAKKISVCRDYRFLPLGQIRSANYGIRLIKKGVKSKEVKLVDKSFRHFR